MTGKNYVGFDLSAKGNQFFQTVNPIKNTDNPTVFIQATSEEVETSVALATTAYEAIQKITLSKRADFLWEIAMQIELLGDTLIETYIAESGLSCERALVERTRAINQIKDFAQHVRSGEWMHVSIDTSDTNRIPQKPDLRKMMVGIGPIVVFGASNFPLAYSTAGGDTIAALAAGCPVIVKSHPYHAGTGELIADAVIAAAKNTSMPNGIFSNLNAIDFKVAHQLVVHPKIKAIGFTGSFAGGKALFDLAATRSEPIPVFAEMGSINPVIIFPAYLKEKMNEWADILANSITYDAGQFCTKPGIIFLLDSENSNLFTEKLVEKIINKRAFTMLHPKIYEEYCSRVNKLKEIKELTRFEKKEHLGTYEGLPSLFITEASSFMQHNLLREEVFGPFALVVKCKDVTELQQCIAEINGQLTATILASVEEISFHSSILVALRERVGRVVFNGVPTGVEVCPSANHGGAYPATTDSRFTAVGIDSIERFLRPVVFQNCPESLLHEALKNVNSLQIKRRINGKWTKKDIA